MRVRRFVLPIAVLALVGCDRITGASQQKALDAEAIGYSCRISLKPPEDCIKENDTLSPTSILFGWKEADRDIREKAIDPSMGKQQPAPQPHPGVPPAAATESKPVAEKAATAKSEKPAATAAEKPAAAVSEKPATAKSEKPTATTGEKPAVTTGKPDKGATEKKADQ